MKKIYILALTIFSISLNAQFKKIEFSNVNSTTSSLERISNPFTHINNVVKKDVVFSPKSINKLSMKAAAAGFKIIATDENGRPIAVEGSGKSLGNRSKSIDEKAYDHISQISSFMGFSNDPSEFVISAIQNDDNGNQHVRMNQSWNGIPVYGGEIILHTQDGIVDFANGRTFEKPQQLQTKENVAKTEAINKVNIDLGDVQDLSLFDKTIFNMEQTKSDLVYLKHSDDIKLTHHITIYKNLIDRWEYFVDASNGEILKKYTSICKFHHEIGKKCNHNNIDVENNIVESSNVSTAVPSMLDGAVTATATDLLGKQRSLNTYQKGSGFYMIDVARPMFVPASKMPDDPEGSIWTVDAFNTSPEKNSFNYDHVKSSNNTWSSKVTVSAHYNGGTAYEYYKNTHGRNSINGSGGNIISFINVADADGSGLDNAFWNGAAMFYGNGKSEFKELARGLDVAGHEMTHGVVQNTANLEYEGESGALNESFADVFGSLIDRDDWLMGEDVVKAGSFPSGALRSLIDPHNGAATNDFGNGWQPRIYSERYMGTQDNGGVHLNSGIPNYAYYLFASDAAVGKDKAEKVYYKALTQYLTKSSQFVDARVAITRAAKELYGDAVAAIATSAFDKVQIPGGGGGTYQDDVNNNPGQDYILFTSADKKQLFIFTVDGKAVANPLSKNNPISRPSITDDGSLILYVADDKKIHAISIDWAAGTSSEQILNTGTATWRNVSVSKDGKRASALRSVEENKMLVFDLTSGNGNEYTLTNPTFTQGVSTGDVLYADAMEWDFSGEYVMYDAENEIKSNTAGTINYWDIGFINVWNKKSNNFALDGKIEKLFPALDEGESVGNPTFSKNSPYIIAFDYLNGQDWAVLGANTEAGDIGSITDNNTTGYPSFSNKDNAIIYTTSGTAADDINFIGLKNTKIEGNTSQKGNYMEDATWGVWFSNGTRKLDTSIKDIQENNSKLSLSPNPVSSDLSLMFESTVSSSVSYSIEDITGKIIKTGSEKLSIGNNTINVNVSDIYKGMYIVKLSIENNKQTAAAKFVKL